MRMLCEGFKCRVIARGPHPSQERGGLGTECTELQEALRKDDSIISHNIIMFLVHLPLFLEFDVRYARKLRKPAA